MRLSLQLYTVRDPLANDLVGTLTDIRSMGLEFVELAGTQGLKASEFRTVLDSVGLSVSGGHWGLEALESDVNQVAEEALALGCEHVVLPWIPKEAYEHGWVAFGRRLEPIARSLSEHELTFSYHNHAFELDPNPHSSFRDMWNQAPPIVRAQLDLGWLAVAGEDPIEWIDELGDRAHLVHLKDYSGKRDSHDAEAGAGTLDWPAILKACERNQVQFGAIEMDRTPREPLVSVRHSVDYFRSLGIN